MFTMNVPKFMWSEAVMMATFLINRTPSRVIGLKSPCELIFTENKFPVPPKVFVLFVIIGHQSTNWILEQSSVSLLGTLQDKEGTNAGVHLK